MALTYNVVLGPWIYVGSSIRNHAAAMFDVIFERSVSCCPTRARFYARF